MRKVVLDKTPAVKRFIKSLKLDHDGVELEADGKIVAKVVPPTQLSEAEKQAMVDKTWKMIREVRERNRHVPARVIEREVREAVDEVRRRQRSS